MRGITTQKKQIINPVDFFKENPEILVKAISEGIDVFFHADSTSFPCCFHFFKKNSTADFAYAGQIKLMIQAGLKNDLLMCRDLFHAQRDYLSFILICLNAKAGERIEFEPSLDIGNIQNVFWELGLAYNSTAHFDDEDSQFNKLTQILDRYKIIFLKSQLDNNSIITPPMHSFIDEHIHLRNLSAVIEFLLKSKVKDSFLVYTDQKGTITITRPKINFLSEFQKKILKHGKGMVQNYFKRQTIKIENEIVDTLKYSEEDKLKPAPQKHVEYSTNIDFKNLKNSIEQDFGHYGLSIEYITTDYNNRFKFISLKNSDVLINFFRHLTDPDDDNIFIFEGIDNISAIVEPFLSEKYLKEIVVTSPKDSKITAKMQAHSDQFLLRIPMQNESNKHLCHGRINMTLDCSSLPELKVNAKNKLSIEFTSRHKALLMMMEVKLKGFKDAFTHLMMKFGGIEAYHGSHTHLVEQKSPQKLSPWKGTTYVAKTSRYRYLKLAKEIASEDGLNYLYEIQKILGDDYFKVALLDNDELMDLDDFFEPTGHELPRPSFFNQYNKNKNQDVANILKKLEYRAEIDSKEWALLKKHRPLKNKEKTQILIRGITDHHTQLLEYFCAAIVNSQISEINLPNVKNIILEFLGIHVEDMTTSPLPALTMR